MTSPLDKQRLRAEAKARRAALPPAEARAAALAMADRFREGIAVPPNVTTAGYWPLEGEADPRPLLQSLAARGCSLALPGQGEPGRVLNFRRWQAGDPLSPGRYGILAPSDAAPLVRPDIVLVPLLAFDGAGHRLGYGGGFYDRTLAALRAEGAVLAIGLGFARQEVAALPAESFDQKLDWIVTEREARRVV